MYQARSVALTLPLESNPIVLRIAREVNRLREWEESSTSATETISIGLSGIADLYGCVGQFLSLPFIQQALSLHQRDRSFVELLEGSEKLLEVCCEIGAVVGEMREASRRLKGSLKGGNSQGSGVSCFLVTRKQIRKSARKALLSLRRAERGSFRSSEAMLVNDQGVSMVIKVLTCVSIISISVIEALLYFLAMPVSKCQAGKFAFVLKMMRRAKVVCDTLGEDQSKNELENLDFALYALASNDGFKEENVRDVCKRVSTLEDGLKGIENGVEGMIFQLSQTRTTLLEVFTS